MKPNWFFTLKVGDIVMQKCDNKKFIVTEIGSGSIRLDKIGEKELRVIFWRDFTADFVDAPEQLVKRALGL